MEQILYHRFVPAGTLLLLVVRHIRGYMKIFISYAFKDGINAKKLKKMLEQANNVCFLAQVSINPGDDWKEKIINELSSSEIVIVLVTKNSIKSTAVMHEIGGAVFARKTVIPILYNLSSNKIPVWVSNYQAISYEDFDINTIERSVKGNSAGTLSKLVIAGSLIYFIRKIITKEENRENTKKRTLAKSINDILEAINKLRDSFPIKF